MPNRLPLRAPGTANFAGLRPRYALLLGLLAIGLLWLLVRADDLVAAAGGRPVRLALEAGGVAALATAAGTLPVLLAHRVSQRACDLMLGFGAGVMLAACSFSLIIPGLAAAERLGLGEWGAGAMVGGGLLAGALLLLAMDWVVPHEHFIKGVEGRSAKALRRAWLFVFAIALHNLPEGLAIGVAFGGGDAVSAGALATGIAVQDVPEGLVVALALRSAGYSRLGACALGVLSGLVEPVAAGAGAALVLLASGLLPFGLAAAAGAMLFVISHEIIPETHGHGNERLATIGLVVGFVLMMLLDTALG